MVETKLQSHRCSELERSLAHHEVRLAGWVSEKRDLGNLIFLVLRDASGCVQLFLEKKCNPLLYERLALLTKFSALAVKGVLFERRSSALSPASTPQDEVEVQVQSIEWMNLAAPIPLLLIQESRPEASLRYRYLELRQGPLLGHLKKRAQILGAIRSYLESLQFIEVETPILTAQTPEGARDYLVPSRLHWGKWYALPQSPQLFKQLLVIGGIPRYYQIARCFRDEDLRQDRQPEFTQLDCEASFVGAQEIQVWIEGLVRALFNRFCGVDLPDFPRLSFDEAFSNYGSDKPDLRWPEKLVEMKDWIFPSPGEPFSASESQGGWSAWGLKIPKGVIQSRSVGEALQSEWEAKGWKRPLWIRQSENGQLQGLPKWLNAEKAQQGLKRFNLQVGEGLWWVQGPRRSTLSQLGQLRAQWIQALPHSANTFCPVWVTDFPMFDPFDAEEGRLTPMHHPFTQPQGFEEFDVRKLDSIDARELRAEAYDLVINGYEVGGGSTRISNPSLQRWIFGKCGLSSEVQERQFGFLLEALSFGAPPHSGIALGLDRLVMLMLGLEKIREVIAFPKTASAACPLTGAPKLPAPGALEVLGLGEKHRS